MPYLHQNNPVPVPDAGEKTIFEHFGHFGLGDGSISVAHLIAPSEWTEPPQQPDFDEYTLLAREKKRIHVDGEEIVLAESGSILVNAGSVVQYSNPFETEVEYWSVCIPAFSPDTVHRKSQD